MKERRLQEVSERPLKNIDCRHCSLSSLCLPISLTTPEMDRLDDIVNRGTPKKKGEYIYHQGDSFDSIYVVRAGAVKTFNLSSSGEEQITGFHLPSELIGLNGMDVSAYPVSAVALETTTLCEIPFSQLDKLSGELPELRRQVMRMMSKEIREDQEMMMLLSKKTAEERLATFLVSLSSRFKRRGYSPTVFRLSMSRNDIGNYLGLAVETVSRVFTRFQKQGLISIQSHGKEVVLENYDDIQTLSGISPPQEQHDCELIANSSTPPPL